MGIPYAKTYHANSSGVALKLVLCESCGAEYFYLLSRTGSGSGTSVLFLDNAGAADRAELESQRDLENQLNSSIDAVPCPKCGLYQANMIPEIRGGLYWWMIGVAAACFLAAFVSFLVVLPATLYNLPGVPPERRMALGIGMILGIVAGAVVLKLRQRKCAEYDPNALEFEVRRRSCKQPAMLREELERDGPDRLFAPVVQAQQASVGSDLKFNLILRLAICLFFVGLGVVLLYQMRDEIQDGLASPNWPSTEATVVTAGLGFEHSQEKRRVITHYKPEVTYQYRVDDKEYRGSRFRFEPVKSQDQLEMQNLIRMFEPGTRTNIRYKPSDPAVAVMIPGLSGFRVGFVVVLGLCVLGGLIGALCVVRFYQSAIRAIAPS